MIHRLLRSAVLRTAHIEVLDRIYQRYYSHVADALVSRFGESLGGVAVLLRADAEGHRFEPGLSDIDFALVHPTRTSLEQTRFLEGFWSKYRTMKRVHPILGEVGIFDIAEFREFAKVGGGPTGVGKRWKIIASTLSEESTRNIEESCILLSNSSKPAQTALLQDVFTRYSFYYLPRLYRFLQRPQFASRRELEHVGTNLLRRVARPGLVESPLDTLPGLFAVLSEISRLDFPEPVDSPPVEARGLAPGRVRSVRPLSDRLRSLGAEVVLGTSEPISDCFTVLVVLPDNIGAEQLILAAELSGALMQKVNTFPRAPSTLAAMYPTYSTPLLLPRSALAAWIKTYPFEASAIRATSAPESVPTEWPQVRASDVLQACRTFYGGMLTMKNNWRTSRTQEERVRLYECGAPRIARAVRAARAGGRTIEFGCLPKIPFTGVENGLEGTRSALHNLRESL